MRIIQRKYNTEKRKHGKGRQEQFAKTARMTTATLDVNFENHVDQTLAIQQLQNELDARDTELQDELDANNYEMNDAEDTRKLHLSSGTSPSLPYAMVVGVVQSVASGRGGGKGGPRCLTLMSSVGIRKLVKMILLDQQDKLDSKHVWLLWISLELHSTTSRYTL